MKAERWRYQSVENLKNEQIWKIPLESIESMELMAQNIWNWHLEQTKSRKYTRYLLIRGMWRTLKRVWNIAVTICNHNAYYKWVNIKLWKLWNFLKLLDARDWKRSIRGESNLYGNRLINSNNRPVCFWNSTTKFNYEKTRSVLTDAYECFPISNFSKEKVAHYQIKLGQRVWDN